MMRQLPFEYAFRNLGRSPLRLAASLLGAALVVLLALVAAGFVQGMHQTLTQHQTLHRNVVLLGSGSEEAIERSQIDASVATIAMASIGHVKQAGGVPFVSPEIHIGLPLRESADAPERQAVLRGITPAAFLVHSEVELVEGRAPRAGREELIVGALAATRLGLPPERLALGQTLHLDHRDWTIVGRFRAPNTVMDAEVWLPLTDLQIATRREASLSCVVLTLGEQGTFADADLFAKSRLDLEIVALRESDYYASIGAFYRPIRVMVLVTAALIAAGGLLGGLNTMYAAFAARVREVGMLQSLGFTRLAIVLNLSEESLFASACGTILGLLIGLLTLDGLAVSFSMGAFALQLDSLVLLIGIGSGLMVGLIGAIPPAIRCLRLPITEALRSF
jgi:ABC-type lipoprotein release transport system permease subunit